MPTLDERGDHEGGLIALVRETASGFGQLVADHIRLARLRLFGGSHRTLGADVRFEPTLEAEAGKNRHEAASGLDFDAATSMNPRSRRTDTRTFSFKLLMK